MTVGVSPFDVEPYVGLESLAKDTGGLYVDATNDFTAFARKGYLAEKPHAR